MENNKIHWRTVYKTDFLASWDLDHKDEILTIDFAESKECQLSRGKEVKVVINFIEKKLSNGIDLKPMICNATNSKIISNAVKSGVLSDWSNYSVVLSVKENKGKVGASEGLFIKDVFINTFDITFILNETDLKKAQNLATENGSKMSNIQIEIIKEHLKTLKNAK